MYYVHYAPETGQILGFYHPDIHSDIPEPNIEISDQEWQMANGENAYIVEGGELMIAPQPSAVDLDKITQTRALEEIDLASIAPLRALALDLARGMTLPEAAEAARVKLQELEANAQALKGDGENADV